MQKVERVEDSKQIIDIMTSAFQDDPTFKYVVRNDEKYTDALRMLYEEFITPCISPETNVFINEEKNGAILWWKSDYEPHGFWFTMNYLLHFFKWYDIFGSLSGMIKAYRFIKFFDTVYPTYPHLYLFMVGVVPGSKGKGYGSKLMKPMIEYADKYNYPIYLESSKPENLSFYKKHGFEVLGRIQPYSDRPPFWPMLRPMRDPIQPVGTLLEPKE